MARILAENISLTLPLTTPIARKAKGNVETGTAVVSAGTGRVIAKASGQLGGVQALDGISLSLESGDRLAIVGRNGSGKSTLLRVLAGIYEPDAGRLELEGEPAGMFDVRLGMQIDLSGMDNIYLRGMVAGVSRADIDANLNEIIDFADLGDFIHLPIHTYSAGMAMRLAFAISTAFQPDILLLDEWIGAGDEAFRKKARARMETLVDRAGIVVLAAHNRGLLRNVCNKGLWLDSGRVRMFGQIDAVIDAYAADLEAP